MFSTVESCSTNRAVNSLVASSIMWIRYSWGPRPSSQSCSLVSHCTISPREALRRRHWWTDSTFCLRPAWAAKVVHERRLRLLSYVPRFDLQLSFAHQALYFLKPLWTVHAVS